MSGKSGRLPSPRPRRWSSTSRGVPLCQTSLPPRPPPAPTPHNPARNRTRRHPVEIMHLPQGRRPLGLRGRPPPHGQRPDRATGLLLRVPAPRVWPVQLVRRTRASLAHRGLKRGSPPNAPCRVFPSGPRTRHPTNHLTGHLVRHSAGVRTNRRTPRRPSPPNGPPNGRGRGLHGLRTALPDVPARAAAASPARLRAATAQSPRPRLLRLVRLVRLVRPNLSRPGLPWTRPDPGPARAAPRPPM